MSSSGKQGDPISPTGCQAQPHLSRLPLYPQGQHREGTPLMAGRKGMNGGLARGKASCRLFEPSHTQSATRTEAGQGQGRCWLSSLGLGKGTKWDSGDWLHCPPWPCAHPSPFPTAFSSTTTVTMKRIALAGVAPLLGASSHMRDERLLVRLPVRTCT